MLRKNPTLLLPPGYKKKEKLKLEHKYSVPNCMKRVLNEAKVISLEIIDYIIQNAINKHTLEPYKMQSNNFEIIRTFNKVNWKPAVTLAYLKLPKVLKKEGIEVGSLIEEMLHALELGKTSLNERIVNQKEMNDKMLLDNMIEEDNKKELMNLERQYFQKKELEKDREEKKHRDIKLQEELSKLKEGREEKLKMQILPLW